MNDNEKQAPAADLAKQAQDADAKPEAEKLLPDVATSKPAIPDDELPKAHSEQND